MDKLDSRVLDSMHILASAMVSKQPSETSLCVDYNEEEIEFEYNPDSSSSITMPINCRCDSQIGAIKDFAKQLLLQVET